MGRGRVNSTATAVRQEACQYQYQDSEMEESLLILPGKMQ